ncbi:unnamed protein product [Ranitomeya imitator]|uniref:Uncharacterized protein n=1 Tax=Ranitomeya imitator TaxID=111125 RepID=A0ABN9LCK8_9NEOB|nr:unnamed protein product [Ranitomeya imitator]
MKQQEGSVTRRWEAPDQDLRHPSDRTAPGTMDPALLRDRELFKKRALNTPAVEKRSSASESSKKKKAKVEISGTSSSKQGSGMKRSSQVCCAGSGHQGEKRFYAGQLGNRLASLPRALLPSLRTRDFRHQSAPTRQGLGGILRLEASLSSPAPLLLQRCARDEGFRSEAGGRRK